MNAKTIDADVVVEKIVACPGCGRKNRLRQRTGSGVYRCGSCGKSLGDPFPKYSRPVRRRPPITAWISILATVLLFGLLIWDVCSQPTSPTSRFAASPPAAPSALERSLPPNGEVRTFTQQEQVAPFEIQSPWGTNFLLKLADAASGEPVLTIFVRGGETVKVKVPLGTYVVKYASGDMWYGYEQLFGEKTSYSKASQRFTFDRFGNQTTGYTLTLYQVLNGNLHTENIQPQEF